MDHIINIGIVSSAWAIGSPLLRVIGQGADALGSWLVTAGVPGDSAICERWLGAPDRAVRAIGRGLRALHDSLAVEGCPFSWSLKKRLADVRHRAEAGLLDPAQFHPQHQSLPVQQALALLAAALPVDDSSFATATPAPQTRFSPTTAAGRVTWTSAPWVSRTGGRADVAVATWSNEWK